MPSAPSLRKRRISGGLGDEDENSKIEGSASGSGSGSGSGGNEGNNDNINNDNPYSTAGSSLPPSLRSATSNSASLSGSGSSFVSSRLPAIDTREQYSGYAFVFATDVDHSREPVYGNRAGSSISYLKSKPSHSHGHQGQSIDTSSSPDRSTYFFTAFRWRNVNSRACTMSRVGVCDAWQIAFNRLIYYASFLEENTVRLRAIDVEFFKKEFAAWNDLFCELDQTLGRLVQCEIANLIPQFQPSLPLAAITNPQNATNADTPLHCLSSTFLCAAREICAKNNREIEQPLEAVRLIEESDEGWEPCTGYTIVRATTWDENGDPGEDECEEERGRANVEARARQGGLRGDPT